MKKTEKSYQRAEIECIQTKVSFKEHRFISHVLAIVKTTAVLSEKVTIAASAQKVKNAGVKSK